MKADELLYFKSEKGTNYAAGTLKDKGPLEFCWRQPDLLGFYGNERTQTSSNEGHAYIWEAVHRSEYVFIFHKFPKSKSGYLASEFLYMRLVQNVADTYVETNMGKN
jgi:hypothetical protein